MQRSEVWKFFSKQGENEANCKICFKTIKTCGNTSNMNKHLKMHPHCFKKEASQEVSSASKLRFVRVEPCEPSSTSQNDVATESVEDCEIVSVEKASASSKPRQMTIKETVSRRISYTEGGAQHNLIIKSILYFICVDKRPFEVVKGKGFARLMKQVCPSFKIPSVELLKTRLEQFYKFKQEEIANYFKGINHCSLTCDVWTEVMTMTSYLGITIHYMENKQLRSRCLTTVQLEERHTTKYLSEVLEEKCKDFNIRKDTITCVVTDGAANIKAVIKDFVGESRHLTCFAHKINLIVQAVIGIEEVKFLCEKVRTVVIFFRKSVIQSDLLRSKQSGNPLKLILDVKTRWNSVFYMLQRYCELAQLVHQILFMNQRAPPLPTTQDLEEIKLLLDFLKPFEYVTKDISGDQYVTASKVIAIVNTLKKQIENIYVIPRNIMLKKVKETIILEMQKRFSKVEENNVLATATLLDPRFKHVPFVNTALLEGAKFRIRNELILTSNKSISSDSDSTCSDESKYDFWKQYKSMAHGNTKQIKSTDESELATFLRSPVISLHNDPLLQWDDMKNCFPSLYNVAEKYLAVPATSVPSERLFSKAGLIMSKTRNRLGPKRLDKLLFLSDLSEKEWDL